MADAGDRRQTKLPEPGAGRSGGRGPGAVVCTGEPRLTPMMP